MLKVRAFQAHQKFSRYCFSGLILTYREFGLVELKVLFLKGNAAVPHYPSKKVFIPN